MPSFNLIHEPWLPVLDADGRRHEVGLRDALVHAHQWREVYADNPIETAALNRLLLAIVIDGFLPHPDEDAWWDRWEAGRFDEHAVDAYFADPVRADRFDLLHPERPFYQHPEPLAKDPAPLSKLFHAEASGNNATLFGHEVDAFPRPRSLAETARAVVCTQAAALGGGVSKPFNFSHAPLVGGAVFWIRGRSLFEALLLNASPEPDARMMLHENDDPGWPPAWERPLPEIHARRPVHGYRDYLTWQARRLTLVTETQPGGETVATAVYITQGDKDDPLVQNDPLMASAVSRNKGVFPYGLRADRAVWRDADTLFKLLRPGEGGSPRTFSWLREVHRLTGIDRYAVDVFGLINDQAKVEMWRHEQMPVFPALLADAADEGQPIHQIQGALDLANEQSDIIKNAMWWTSAYLVLPPKMGDTRSREEIDENIIQEARKLPKDKKTKKSRIDRLVDAIDARPSFWAALEPHFHAFLARLAEHAADDYDTRQAILWDWAKIVYEAAREAFRAATAHLDRDAWQLRAVAEGTRRLMRPRAFREHLQTLTTEEA
ncbi:type I-E CRISPR-associated protein Cse1/CasA [Rhodocaloribacter litoris]|uniref:type I-E CRISPR-associated protein Cse1/CasA n=1 Tax=Rhodocaloribacter litoris TaxID=2558931 RepID=UPI0014247A3A|nr:type I-E CRISPR-associated protein Cse1/CasA [Rhodocaloribacter litoris]QXD16409.1 type I-E CRISPR-associated protein Cse1/CasA [Rhodocaloribacter litoris]